MLFVIERRDFLPILQAEPEVAMKLIEVLCALLRHVTAQTENLMFRSLASRLATALLQLTESSAGERTPKVAITQRDLGNLTGMTREGINKQLQVWEANNLVRLERGAILIKSFEKLSAIASND
jgi:CRP/FNR family cyclic AMP-dependent transcriptional regulator